MEVKRAAAGSSCQCTRGENIPPIQRAGGQRSLVEITFFCCCEKQFDFLKVIQEGATQKPTLHRQETAPDVLSSQDLRDCFSLVFFKFKMFKNDTEDERKNKV